MPVYVLEILVVALGLVLLMVEAFLPPTVPKRRIGLSAMIGLGAIFVLLFLFLLLLEKRELAAIQYAVTEPIIKVVDYALSSSEPVFIE